LKCGKQLQHEEQEYCEDCKKNRHLYIQGSALYDYGSMADSIFRFKYAGRMEYADFYGRELYERKAGWLSMVQPDALVPVPIHAARKRKRGYNQAELVARHLSSLCGVPVNNSLIYRPKQTAPLKDLSHSERQNNLKRAFKIRQNDVKLSTIVIIDDIYTTGSTIDAMSEVLHQAGISDVYFMTLTVGRGI
jgi:ComF family protein